MAGICGGVQMKRWEKTLELEPLAILVLLPVLTASTKGALAAAV